MSQHQEKEIAKAIVKVSRYLVLLTSLVVGIIFILVISLFNSQTDTNANPGIKTPSISSTETNFPVLSNFRDIPANMWKAPDVQTIPSGKDGEMIRYGRELITSTAKYFGPNGSIAHLSNGMNCQNCHLNAGTKLFSNNFASFIASYPKYSPRSGKMESAAERIADCFQRSLNGRVPDTSQKEIRAIIAYMKWVGQDVKKGGKVFGTSTEKLIFLDKAADPIKGKVVFINKCQSCHGKNGEGLWTTDKKSYTYPPLWGPHSYDDGAGMYRIINFAGFVKNNMPFGATYQNPQLSDEEAWNVAAFVNSQPRPHKDQHQDYPDLKQKPIDLPFGPYADRFSTRQHKYGPFKPIRDSRKQ